MDIQQQIEGLQIQVNGGVIEAQVSTCYGENIVLTDIGNSQYLITEKSFNGVNVSINGNEYMFYGQTNKAQNGIYVAVGYNGVDFILRRSSSYITYTGIAGSMGAGTRIQIYEGDRDGDVFFMTTTEPFVLNTTPINIVFLPNGIQNLTEAVMQLQEEINGGEF